MRLLTGAPLIDLRRLQGRRRRIIGRRRVAAGRIGRRGRRRLGERRAGKHQDGEREGETEALHYLGLSPRDPPLASAWARSFGTTGRRGCWQLAAQARFGTLGLVGARHELQDPGEIGVGGLAVAARQQGEAVLEQRPGMVGASCAARARPRPAPGRIAGIAPGRRQQHPGLDACRPEAAVTVRSRRWRAATGAGQRSSARDRPRGRDRRT